MMKKIIGFFLFLCLLLGGCAKNDQTVWRVSTLDSTNAINLPVAGAAGFCSEMTERQINVDTPQKKSITVDGKTYTGEYIETLCAPNVKQKTLLKQRRMKDCYETEEEINMMFYPQSNLPAEILFPIKSMQEGTSYNKETAGEKALYYLRLFYEDADSYKIRFSLEEKKSTATIYFQVHLRRYINGVATGDGFLVWIDGAGNFSGLRSYDYQLYNDCMPMPEQITAAKMRLEEAAEANNLKINEEPRVIMGDDGNLYLVVLTEQFISYGDEVGSTISDEIFTRI